MASREQIASALFNLLKSSSEFVTSGRRNTDPEGLGPTQTPALFLVERDDDWDRSQGFNQFAKRTMRFWAIVYSDVGTNDAAVPNTIVNNILDAIDLVMQPDDVLEGTLTLGGLVQAVTLDGATQRSSGDTTGKALAIVPIRVLIP